MTDGASSKSTVSLPAGVSLLRVGQVMLDAWSAGAHQWTDSPLRRDVLKDAPAPSMPVPRDALELFATLQQQGIPYLLIGGMALLTYLEGRNTDDVDLLMSLADVRRIAGLRIEDQNESFARGQFRSLQVDFLLTANPLFRQVQERFATRHRFAEGDVPCVTIEGLIVLKLYALPSLYRQMRLDRAALYENDLAMLLLWHPIKLEPLLDLVKPHVLPGDATELGKVIREVEQRVQRLRQSGSA